ncbi:MAG: coproporphyrinogen dehydrogenase HemZ [Candidatus Borkfalkiaceae bacterium]|nr:coproporphyrinogen dehydrogenase HemZ [Clostridia bacterium]MDY6223273.1 coproporphyrinogen dehydrogenase HemZ [Christensenellaceae bacterium]
MLTDCLFLQNELYDVARLFKNRPETLSHSFRFENGIFYNTFIVDGRTYAYEDKAAFEGELEFKRKEKLFAKQRLYSILSEKYGETMPWGALTGIRPTKLAYRETEEGRDFRSLFSFMGVSEENAELTAQILKAQEGIYEKNENNADYFVSLPFCPSKCEYCSFITAPIDKTRAYLPDYIACLTREIRESAPLIGNLRSVYIGGGTPFAVDTNDLKRVLQAVEKLRRNDCEYTVEAGRPDVFTEEKLRLLKDYGVTRICINPQSFSDETLKKIGRKHTAGDVYRAFEMSEKYGFLINLDLIAGLADEGLEEFSYSLSEAIRLAPDNITVHCLCLKSGAKLKEETSYLDEPVVSEMVAHSRKVLPENGYRPYYMYRQKYQAGNNENVGWARPGTECVYNVDVMEEIADNVAAGANAVSKKVRFSNGKIERYAAPKDLKTYIEKTDAIIREKTEFYKK